MMGQSPQCYIPSFVEIGPPVPEKIFFMVFTIYVGHVTEILRTTFVPHIHGCSTSKAYVSKIDLAIK